MDGLFVGQWALEIRLDVFHDSREVGTGEVFRTLKIARFNRTRRHSFPSNPRIDIARVNAKFLYLRDLEEAVVALDVFRCFVRTEILRDLDAAAAQVQPDAGVHILLTGEIVV